MTLTIQPMAPQTANSKNLNKQNVNFKQNHQTKVSDTFSKSNSVSFQANTLEIAPGFWPKFRKFWKAASKGKFDNGKLKSTIMASMKKALSELPDYNSTTTLSCITRIDRNPWNESVPYLMHIYFQTTGKNKLPGEQKVLYAMLCEDDRKPMTLKRMDKEAETFGKTVENAIKSFAEKNESSK